MLVACPAAGRQKIHHARALLSQFPNLTAARLAIVTGADKSVLRQDPEIAVKFGFSAPLSETEQAMLVACPAAGRKKIRHARALLRRFPDLTTARLAVLSGADKSVLLHDPEIAGKSDRRAPLSGKEEIETVSCEEIASSEIVIKEEEDIVTWQTHQMNNDLPILQDWHNPSVSVLEQAENGGNKLQVTWWGTIFNPLPRKTKYRINQEVQWFLDNEGNHGARMDAMLHVAIPLDDEDGYRGRSVFANHDLPAYTVLGPYSGRYLQSEEKLKEYEKEFGLEAGNYYFATRSQKRLIAAYPEGNILSLINSPNFNKPESDSDQISERQNVSTVLVGKNINFFVTTLAIRKGEELWFDYGPSYRHFEPHEDLRSVQVKQEPPAE